MAPLGPPFVSSAGALAAVLARAPTVLDTRGLAAYVGGHIPGAVRVDWRIGTTGGPTSGTLGPPDAVAAAFAALGVDASRPVLVVGAWTEGWGEEGRIAWDLAYLGHQDTWILAGGMAAWTGPQDHLPARPQAGRFAAQPRASLRVTTEALARVVGGTVDGATPPVLLDVRQPDEFAGARKYGEARGGHVPGARNVPWASLLDGPPDGLPRDAPVVTYCTGGVRSGMAWAILTGLGYAQVTNYDGSWWEWSRSAQ